MIASLTRRYSRRALTRPNAVYHLWRFVGNGLRTALALASRVAYEDSSRMAAELRREGIAVGRSDHFLSDEGRVALAQATEEVLRASGSDAVEATIAGTAGPSDRPKDFVVHLAPFPDGMPPDSPLLRVALDRKLLEIVAAYFGFWPCLHSVGAWLNYPTDAPAESSQLWHRDPEDLRIVKVFIYVNDVDEDRGPFTYVPRTHSFGEETARAARFERKKRVPEDRMSRVFPPDAWRVCTGTAGTMILADTVGYHRGGKPVAGRRILITFTYTSGTPITERPLWLSGRPRWISSPIQRWAMRSLLALPPSRTATKAHKKKKKKRRQ